MFEARYLFAGTRLYSNVYAVNAAGIASAGVSSDVVVIDSSPPLPLYKFQLGQNLLNNPSFEEGAFVTESDEVVPNMWDGKGTLHLNKSSDDVDAQDRRTFLDVISGYVEQTIATNNTTKYRATFYVHPPTNDLFHSQQLGFVRLPGFHATFVVGPMVATFGEQWQKHVYYFTASDTISTVRVGALGHKTGFLLDNVQIREVGIGRRSPSADQGGLNITHQVERNLTNQFDSNLTYAQPIHVQPMHVHLQLRGSYASLTAAWDVEDPDSPVTNYLWCIGTVRGMYINYFDCTIMTLSRFVSGHIIM